mgnify:CR=1 FL=1
MLFVLSPAKSLDYEAPGPAVTPTSTQFNAQSKQLIGLLRPDDGNIYLGDREVALRTSPTPDKPSLAALIDVSIPRPRSQLDTKEHREFLRLRRDLYRFLGH